MSLESRNPLSSEPFNKSEQICIFIYEYMKRKERLPTFREIEKAIGIRNPSHVHYYIKKLRKIGYIPSPEEEEKDFTIFNRELREKGYITREEELEEEEKGEEIAKYRSPVRSIKLTELGIKYVKSILNIDIDELIPDISDNETVEPATDISGIGIDELIPDISDRKAVEPTPGIPVMGTIAAGSPIEMYAAPESMIDTGLFLVWERERESSNVYALVVKGSSMIEDGIFDKDYVVIREQNASETGEIIVAIHKEYDSAGSATLKRFFQEKEHDRIRLQPANSEVKPIFIPKQEWDNEWLILGKVIAVLHLYNLT